MGKTLEMARDAGGRVWLPGGGKAGLTLLFFSDGGLVRNVCHKKNPAQRPGKAAEAAGDNC
jgi:hypothetical protein